MCLKVITLLAIGQRHRLKLGHYIVAIHKICLINFKRIKNKSRSLRNIILCRFPVKNRIGFKIDACSLDSAAYN